MHTLRIGSYYEIPPMDYEQPALFTWREFYNFRNHVIRLLRAFGTAGPMGEVNLSNSEEDELSFSPEIVKNPDFFVVDDMYNEHDKISRVECLPANLDAVIIESLSSMMRMFPGWHVSFGLGDSGMVVTSEAVLIGGRRFWDCESILDVSERCQRAVDFGPPEPLDDSMNDLWRSVLVGGIDQNVRLPAASSRQWDEIIKSLDAMHSERKDGRLTSFSYGQVRHDLHPQTRRELLCRLLLDLPRLSQEMLTAAKWNIQQDSGRALADSASSAEARELINKIWSSIELAGDKFGQSEIVNWWADILTEVKEPSDLLRKELDEDMRVRVKNSDSFVPLSALFGLARLGTHDIASLVESAMISRAEWRANPMLVAWLEKLEHFHGCCIR
jgi:hypothetical protein